MNFDTKEHDIDNQVAEQFEADIWIIGMDLQDLVTNRSSHPLMITYSHTFVKDV